MPRRIGLRTGLVTVARLTYTGLIWLGAVVAPSFGLAVTIAAGVTRRLEEPRSP